MSFNGRFAYNRHSLPHALSKRFEKHVWIQESPKHTTLVTHLDPFPCEQSAKLCFCEGLGPDHERSSAGRSEEIPKRLAHSSWCIAPCRGQVQGLATGHLLDGRRLDVKGLRAGGTQGSASGQAIGRDFQFTVNPCISIRRVMLITCRWSRSSPDLCGRYDSTAVHPRPLQTMHALVCGLPMLGKT